MSEKARQDEKLAYTHRSEVAGTSDPAADPALEHQDPATPDPTDRNEVARETRPGGGQGTGPSTHQSLRTVSRNTPAE